MTLRRLVPAIVWVGMLIAGVRVMEGQTLSYPKSQMGGQVDVYHGVTVADPYRWLEDDVRTSADVKAWVEAQNKLSFGFLEQIPERKTLQERLTKLWNYEKFSAPSKQGPRYVFSKNNGLQNQFVLYTQTKLDAEPEVLIDPNTWSADGTVALAGTAFSDDGRHLAYAVQDAGSDWHSFKVMDVETRKPLVDELKWIKFNTPDWLKDGSGFFYARYPEPEAGASFQKLNLNQKVYLHKLGTPQSEDQLIFANPEEPTWGFQSQVSDDGKHLIITAWKGTDDKYRVYYKSIDKLSADAVHLVGDFDAEYSFIGNDGLIFYFRTDHKAPNRRVIAIDTIWPKRENWREVIPEAGNVLDDIHLVGNQFFASYLKSAVSEVKVHDVSGRFLRDVAFEGLGTASGFGGKRTDTETFYTYSSYATPPSIFRYDLATGSSTLLRRAQVDINPADYVVEQVFFTSKDGTKVPMFITSKKGLKQDGRNPTLLYGYGGFNIALTPAFSVSRVLWLEMGGVFAVANLRGGGEYGETWHQLGTKLDKQNVFDDFIAAAEYLIDKKYTSPDKLAIQGGSNGGLLVGACMTQRPELYAAALPAVGVMDMLRFHQFTAGRFWVDDYGSADDADQFRALYAYSPYHNLKPGTKYPATLVTTADTDDRVVPGHSFKFAARLQACQTGPVPTLIRIETRAGHGAGKPTTKIIEETSDQLAFLVKVLGMKLPSQ
ncbi:MAG: prolyl oligopeptidase family serine peptidase [Planctomycetaceae bacterium]|nr:prolyl oligopeptidase family serine peptidase [Planctomycetaceae bacterium]